MKAFTPGRPQAETRQRRRIDFGALWGCLSAHLISQHHEHAPVVEYAAEKEQHTAVLYKLGGVAFIVSGAPTGRRSEALAAAQETAKLLENYRKAFC
jgi:hypothetical protein